MPLIEYVPKRFNDEHRTIIDDANAIIEDMSSQGYILTLRQLYYRMVATARLPENTIQMYKRFGSIINDARLAGEVDWEMIEDRTRLAHRVASRDVA